jgi:hypothetical protein
MQLFTNGQSIKKLNYLIIKNLFLFYGDQTLAHSYYIRYKLKKLNK